MLRALEAPMKTACVLLAEGFEEVEAITPIDYLRRAGIEVSVVGITGTSATGSRGVAIGADLGPEGLKRDYDAIVAPGGGKGSTNLAASAAVGTFIKRHFAAGKIVAAICAAPALVLGPLGILEGKRFTCFPGMGSGLRGAVHVEERVVVDGKLITSRAAGTAGEFALAIVAALAGKAKAGEIADSVLL